MERILTRAVSTTRDSVLEHVILLLISLYKKKKICRQFLYSVYALFLIRYARTDVVVVAAAENRNACIYDGSLYIFVCNK